MWGYNYNYLQHYSSPYYDPQKAHEYYEEHKKLKGRTSTAKLNEEGKKVASYVKNKINEERDTKLEAETQRHQQEAQIRADAHSRTMEQHRKIMNERITSLQNLIKRMPDAQKADQAPKIKALIYKLREDNDKKRADIQEKYKAETKKSSEETASTKKQIREQAKSTYESEYDKIASESSYQKPSSKKSKEGGYKKWT